MSRIHIQNLTFSYDGSYDNIFENVSFQIDTDWKLGFTGRNGRGKTTFLNLLLGKYEYKGKITASVQFRYFPFEFRGGRENTLEEIRAVNDDFQLWELERELGRLGVRTDVLQQPFQTLSKGEQTKVKLAVLFLQETDFLLIDEPTNHLDEKGRAITASYLASKSGFLLVSHDRAFLDAATDHTLSINKTNIEVQNGNFSSWYRNKQLRDRYEAAENERLQKKSSGSRRPRRKRNAGRIKLKTRKSGAAPGGRKQKASADAPISEKNRDGCSSGAKIWSTVKKTRSMKRKDCSGIWRKRKNSKSGRCPTMRSFWPISRESRSIMALIRFAANLLFR